MTLRRGFAAAIAGSLLGGVLTGCGPTTTDPEISVTVYQPRTDIVHGRLAIQVLNATDAPLEVVAARLGSPDFVADTVWPGDTATVPAGRALDLRAPLPEVRCAADVDPTATIEYVVDGTARVAELGVADPYELLPRLHREACVSEQIAEVATLTPREVVQPDGVAPAVLVIDVEPTGAPGSVTIERVGATTLLQPADAAGDGTDLVELDIDIGADGPTELRIPFVPNRCDPHALLEDKVGTIIPLYVTTTGFAAERWLLPVGDDLRADFYAFVATYCGLPL